MDAEPQVRHITNLVRECELAVYVELRIVKNEGASWKARADWHAIPTKTCRFLPASESGLLHGSSSLLGNYNPCPLRVIKS